MEKSGPNEPRKNINNESTPHGTGSHWFIHSHHYSWKWYLSHWS